jgi:hypothetical protein
MGHDVHVNGYRWFDHHQPQTLQIATMLLYMHGIFALIFGALASALGLLVLVVSVGGAFGMANSKKWGYVLALIAAFLPFLFRLAVDGLSGLVGGDLITLMFDIALVALLVHPMSRSYQKIWYS